MEGGGGRVEGGSGSGFSLSATPAGGGGGGQLGGRRVGLPLVEMK